MVKVMFRVRFRSVMRRSILVYHRELSQLTTAHQKDVDKATCRPPM